MPCELMTMVPCSNCGGRVVEADETGLCPTCGCLTFLGTTIAEVDAALGKLDGDGLEVIAELVRKHIRLSWTTGPTPEEQAALQEPNGRAKAIGMMARRSGKTLRESQASVEAFLFNSQRAAKS